MRPLDMDTFNLWWLVAEEDGNPMLDQCNVEFKRVPVAEPNGYREGLFKRNSDDRHGPIRYEGTNLSVDEYTTKNEVLHGLYRYISPENSVSVILYRDGYIIAYLEFNSSFQENRR